ARGGLVGENREQALGRVVLGAGVRVALRVAHHLGAVTEGLGRHVDNFHSIPLSEREQRTTGRSSATVLCSLTYPKTRMSGVGEGQTLPNPLPFSDRLFVLPLAK